MRAFVINIMAVLIIFPVITQTQSKIFDGWTALKNLRNWLRKEHHQDVK